MILVELRSQYDKLGRKNEELIELGNDYAKATFAYKVAFAKGILLHKSDHPATLLRDIVKGQTSIADLEFKMVVAEQVYNACRESIKDLRSGMEMNRSALSYEKEHYLQTRGEATPF